MLTTFRLTSLLVGRSAQYCFSSRQMSQIAQRAAWSSAFIKEIANPIHPSIIQDHSLHDRLTKLDLKQNKFIFDDHIRDQEIAKFTKGVQLQSKAFNLNKILYSDTYRNKKKLTFQPSLQYTSQIFKALMKTGSISVICGRQQTGKTISILLFTLLSQNVHDLMFGAKQDKGLADELFLLKANNLIADVPKYWYWSMKQRKQKRAEKYFHKILLQQATQLPAQERSRLCKLNTYDEFLEQLNKVYSSTGIQQQFCIDQLENAIKQVNKNEEGKRTQIDEGSAYIGASEFIDKFKKIGLGGYYVLTYDMNGELAYKVSGKLDSQSSLNLSKSNKSLQTISIPDKTKSQAWKSLDMMKNYLHKTCPNKQKERKQILQLLSTKTINEELTLKQFEQFAIKCKKTQSNEKFANLFYLFCFRKSQEKVAVLMQMGQNQEYKQKIKFVQELVKYADKQELSNDYLTIPLPMLQQMAGSPLYELLMQANGIYQQTIGLIINNFTQTATFIWKISDLYQIFCPILASGDRYMQRSSDFQFGYQNLLIDALSSTLQKQGQLSFWTKSITSELAPIQIRQEFRSFKVDVVDKGSNNSSLIFKLEKFLFDCRYASYRSTSQQIYFKKYKDDKGSSTFAICYQSKQGNCYEIYTFQTSILRNLKEREEQSRRFFEYIMTKLQKDVQKKLNFTHVILCTKQEWKAGYQVNQNLQFRFSPFENFSAKNQSQLKLEIAFKCLRSSILMFKDYPID